jgi:BMFP domain-containing protein YqiC
MTKITGQKKRNPRDSTAAVSAKARDRAVAKLEKRIAHLETTITALKKILKPWPI